MQTPTRNPKRAWTAAEIVRLKAAFKAMPVVRLARELGRTTSAVYQRARLEGLCIPQRVKAPDFVAFLREKNAAGWPDAEVARARGVDRHAVAHLRRRLGLPSNQYSDRRRRTQRAATERQLAAAGVRTLAALRSKVFRDRARAAGWPEDLRPRAVQILNALWERGPMTRRQIADAIGLPWLGSRWSLKSSDPEGTYLAHLARRGLVVTLGKLAKFPGRGKGSSQQVYSLPLTIERKAVS